MKYCISFFLFIVIFFLSPQAAFGQEITASPLTVTPTRMPDYQLPYPGLLPDSPFYTLKTVRDRIVEFLIADPLKKTEFYLHQADKRLNTGAFLARSGKYDLAQSTISKGENYFEQSLSAAQEAKMQGMDIGGMLNRFPQAARKHKNVLKDLENDAPKAFKDDFASLRGRVEGFEKRIVLMEKKNKR